MPLPISVSPIGRSRAAPLVVVALVAFAVGAHHFVAVHQCALAEYGNNGAEYLEHEVRSRALDHTAKQWLVAQPLLLPVNLVRLDHEYPALLHLIAAMWARVFGKGIPAAVHLNVVFMALLAASVALASQQLARRLVRVPGDRLAWVAAFAGSSVLLLPAVFATARRYYYDLPMTAWCAAALAALLYLPRSRWAVAAAAAASAAALLTKWTAGFFLLPLWIGAAAQVLEFDEPRGRRKLLLRWLGAGSLTLLLCLPVLCRAGPVASALGSVAGVVGLDVPAPSSLSSVDMALGHGADARKLDPSSHAERSEIGERARYHADGLLRSSIGVALTLALALCLIVGFAGWRMVLIGAVACGFPLLVHVAIVDVRDERLLVAMLPWIVLTCTVAWGTCPWGVARVGTLALVLVAGVTQLAAVDGWLTLPSTLLRSPTEQRGWNMVGERPCSASESIESMARTACEMGRRGGAVTVDPEVWGHLGFGWHLGRLCPAGIGLEVPELSRDSAVLTTRSLTSPWPPPSARVDVQLVERRTVYLYEVERQPSTGP